MWMIGTIWVSVATAFLILHTSGWAMEEVGKSATSLTVTPQGLRLNRLLPNERIMDVEVTAPGIQGNSVQSLQRLNAILLQASHADLRQPGIEKSRKAGEVVSAESQKAELQMRRIQ